MKNDILSEFILLILAGMFLGIMIGVIGHSIAVTEPMQREAVENGYAHWLVIDNATGETKFVWK